MTNQAGIPLDDRFGWVGIDPSCNRLVIAFRGTQTSTDWLHDLDFISEPYRPIQGSGRVHQGFQHVYYAVRDNLLALVQERCGSIREVLVTGHGLGEALATLALPDIVSFLSPTARRAGEPGSHAVQPGKPPGRAHGRQETVASSPTMPPRRSRQRGTRTAISARS